MSSGLTDGWWLFGESDDPERVGQDCPLLSWRQWQSLLDDAGFHRTHCTGIKALGGQAVIVAQSSELSASEDTHELSSEDAFIFSGGLGGLGLLTARVLVESGARHIVLLSRSDRIMDGGEGKNHVTQSGQITIPLMEEMVASIQLPCCCFD